MKKKSRIKEKDKKIADTIGTISKIIVSTFLDIDNEETKTKLSFDNQKLFELEKELFETIKVSNSNFFSKQSKLIETNKALVEELSDSYLIIDNLLLYFIKLAFITKYLKNFEFLHNNEEKTIIIDKINKFTSYEDLKRYYNEVHKKNNLDKQFIL